MRFRDYIKEEGETPTDDSTDAQKGMPGAVPVSDAGAAIDPDDETAEQGGDMYEGFQNIQNIVHILAELDEKQGDEEGETNDIKVRLNEALQTIAEDLEDMVESLEKDEEEEKSDEGEEDEDGEDESEGEDDDEESEHEDGEEESEEDEDK